MQIKSRFRSRSEHTLDSKGRLSFPSRFKDVLRNYESDILMVTNWRGEHLRVYPVSEWELLETKWITQGKEQPGLWRHVRQILSGVTDCTLDKQGRLLLPQTLRGEVQIEKEVVVTGMLEHIEIWSRDGWAAEQKAIQEDAENLEEQLSKLGIF